MENCITPQVFGVVVLSVATVAIIFGMLIHWGLSKI